jgi:RNA polymerase sigma-70 factor (ECF subfamily)
MRLNAWPSREPASDDAALAARVASGDRPALDTVYRRESGPVYRYALAMCGNPAWAADATQEAFLAFVARPGGFDAGRGPLAAYLAGIARHALLAVWRRSADGLPLLEEEDLSEGEPSDALSPEAMLVRAQGVEAVWRAVRTLPWAQREAVVLVDLQERPYALAARIAGVELNTLRTRLHRGRARLAAALAEFAPAPGPDPAVRANADANAGAATNAATNADADVDADVDAGSRAARAATGTSQDMPG